MLGYLERVTEAESVNDLWEMHCEAMAGFGFERLLYGFSRFCTATSLGDPRDFLILSNLDDDYVERFLGDGHYLNAPMLSWALRHTGARSWGELRAGIDGMSEAERAVMALNEAHGLVAGYTLSFGNVSTRARGAIALIAPPGVGQDELDAVWRSCGRQVSAMNQVAHLKIAQLPHARARRALTKRQREALEWVGEGKTAQDIAAIMGLTPATVEKHLRLARQVLDVDTTAQAVLKASFQNQIFVPRS